jgi:hypothetical protein
VTDVTVTKCPECGCEMDPSLGCMCQVPREPALPTQACELIEAVKTRVSDPDALVLLDRLHERVAAMQDRLEDYSTAIHALGFTRVRD